MTKEDIKSLLISLLVILVMTGLIYIQFFAPCEMIMGLPVQSMPARCLSELIGR